MANSTFAEAVHSHEAFLASGHFENQKFSARESCFDQLEDFNATGSRDCDYSDESMDDQFECCECKPLHGVHADDFRHDFCECHDSCVHKHHVADPDADLDRRIESSVEKAISDILSDVVNRCISSSLKDCIKI